MMRAIDQRPKRAGDLGILGLPAKQACSNPEQNPSAQFEASHLRFIPGEGLQKR